MASDIVASDMMASDVVAVDRKRSGIQGRYRSLLFIGTTLLIAVMSGLFVAGAGNMLLWLISPFVVLIPLGLYLAKEPDASIYSYEKSQDHQPQHWRSAVFWFGVSSSVALCWLAAHHQPLPGLDLQGAALVTVLFALLCIALTWAVLRLPLLSFPLMFTGVTFLFTCSPLILYQTEGYDAFQYWRLVDERSILLGLPVVMLAFAAFLVGALASPVADDAPTSQPQGGRLDGSYADTLRIIGFYLYLFAMLLLIVASLRGSALGLAYEGGYRELADTRKSGEMSRLVVASISWFIPWSLLILTATSRTRRMYVQTVLLAIPAIVLMLLGGARAAPLGAMLLVASGGYLLGYGANWKQSVAVLALVALLIPTMMNLRNIPIREWTPELLWQAVTNRIENTRSYEEPLFDALLVSNSTSYQTLMGTILYVPDREPYRYGMDYLRAIVVAMPFGSTIFSTIGIDLSAEEPSNWLKERLSPTSWAGLGYLQMAEAYLQFGAYGVVLLYLVLGYTVTGLWRRMERGRLEARFFALILLLMMALLIWVRNESVALTRPLVWGVLLIYVLPALLEKQRARRTAQRLLTRAPQDRPILPTF